MSTESNRGGLVAPALLLTALFTWAVTYYAMLPHPSQPLPPPAPPKDRNIVRMDWGQEVDLRLVKGKPKKTSKRVCTMVADGMISTYVHELAHCNGWDHPDNPQTEADYWIPAKYIRPFNGKVVVTLSSDRMGKTIREYAQPGTKFKTSKKTADALCRAKGTKSIKGREILGCAPVLK
jgi:hypothetical protein